MPRGTITHTSIGTETVEQGDFTFINRNIYYRLSPASPWEFLCDARYVVSFVPERQPNPNQQGAQP